MRASRLHQRAGKRLVFAWTSAGDAHQFLRFMARAKDGDARNAAAHHGHFIAAVQARAALAILEDLVREHGQFVLSDKDNAEFRLMSRFVSETANVLQLVQDTLRPRSFDDYVTHVFD